MQHKRHVVQFLLFQQVFKILFAAHLLTLSLMYSFFELGGEPIAAPRWRLPSTAIWVNLGMCYDACFLEFLSVFGDQPRFGGVHVVPKFDAFMFDSIPPSNF